MTKISLSVLKNPGFYLLIAIISFSLLLRIIPILNYNFPFTPDQGRDMLDIRHLVVGKHLTLIGPTTSINGLFLGPFWYYFNSIPFILSQGDPAALVYWIIAWYIFAGIAIWLYFKPKNLIQGTVFSGLFLLTPPLIYASRFSWNANAMPILTVFFLLSLIKLLEKPNKIGSIVLGLAAGIALQIEAAFGVMFMPFALISFFLSKIKIKFYTIAIIAFSVTLLPQLLFELRHDFVMTKTVLSELTGATKTLGHKYSFEERLVNNFNTYLNFSSDTLFLPKQTTQQIYLLSIIFLSIRLFKKRLSSQSKHIFLLSIGFILFSYVFYLFYPYLLKGWFLTGMYVPFLFIIALFLNVSFFVNNNLVKILSLFLILYIFFNLSANQFKLLPEDLYSRSSDKSNLRNQIEVVDFVYENAQNKGFRVYNYVASVYDFTYQYIFWWHGTKQYKYQPNIISYLDNQPEYITNNQTFLNMRKPTDYNDFIFLIVEPDDEIPDRRFAWLGDFDHYCLKNKYTFSWRTETRILVNCNQPRPIQ